MLVGLLGFFMTMELVYNIRRVVSQGRVFPRSGMFMLVTLGLIVVLEAFLFSAGHIVSAYYTFSAAAVPGMYLGFRADPRQ